MAPGKECRTILITGGAGYIGSHCAVKLLENGHKVVAIDNCCNNRTDANGLPFSLNRVQKITGKPVPFYKVDLRDAEAVRKMFTEEMARAGVHKLIHSSSTTVYGKPAQLPLHEAMQTGKGITNPYGKSKYIQEQMIQDFCAVNKNLSAVSLRYFNPIGAHDSGLLGEDSLQDKPNNLLPFMARVAAGTLPQLNVFGSDYDTRDGTCSRFCFFSFILTRLKLYDS